MSLMTLKNRERGSDVYKLITLNGRWFKKEIRASVEKNEEVDDSDIAPTS